jgi:hypothetical protein
MLSAKQLRSYSMSYPPMEMLGRTPTIQKKYECHMSDEKKKNCFIESIKSILACNKYHFVPNDFPYNTSPGIEHWVCWYSNSTEPDKFIHEIKEKNNIISYWKNNSNNMSIQEINHIHIFIQK